jgi:hypothetical protein
VWRDDQPPITIRQKMIDEQRDISYPFTQRGQANRKDLQPVKQIEAKRSRLDPFSQIGICRGNDAHLNRS